jgi:hypothetical protein
MLAVTLWNYVWQELCFRITATSMFCPAFSRIPLNSFLNIRSGSRTITRIPAVLTHFAASGRPGFAPLRILIRILIRTTNEVAAGRMPNRERRIWLVFNLLKNRQRPCPAPILETVSSWDTAPLPNGNLCCIASIFKSARFFR